MNSFLAEIGKKLADRWLDLLIFPGLIWAGALTAGIQLGQADPFDIRRLESWLNQVAAQPAAHTAGTVLLVSGGLLLASAAAGLCVSGIGYALQCLWALSGSGRLARHLVRIRSRWWQRRTETLRAAVATATHPGLRDEDRPTALAAVRVAERHRAKLGSSPPVAPTWIGERFRLAANHVSDAYGIDPGLAWPRLWAVLPDNMRADLTAAQDAYAGAARLLGWGLVYAVTGAIWWPAVIVGAVVSVGGWWRARGTASIVADLIETAFDLYLVDLSEKLRSYSGERMTPALGRKLAQLFEGNRLTGTER